MRVGWGWGSAGAVVVGRGVMLCNVGRREEGGSGVMGWKLERGRFVGFGLRG